MGVCLLAISQAPRCNFPVAFLVFILKPGVQRRAACNRFLFTTEQSRIKKVEQW